MNFLVFAEDPVSHSRRGSIFLKNSLFTILDVVLDDIKIFSFLVITEADIPVVGHVFSFVITKYPLDWRYCFLKVLCVLCNIDNTIHCIVFIIIIIAGIHTSLTRSI